MRALHTLRAPYAHIARVLRTHCTRTAHTLHAYCAHIARVLRTHCTRTAHTLTAICISCAHCVHRPTFAISITRDRAMRTTYSAPTVHRAAHLFHARRRYAFAIF